jgi:hypothetical protein
MGSEAWWRRLLQSRRARSERGAVAVEAALIVPLLAGLFTSMVEFALLLDSGAVVANASRQGARAAATAGRSTDADYRIVQSVLGARGSIPLERIRYIVVYKAANPDGRIPGNCAAAMRNDNSDGVKDVCNIYRPGNSFAVGSSLPWAPSGRANGIEEDRDYIGVYVETTYTSPLALVVRDRTVAKVAVFRMDPGSEQPLSIGGTP